MTANQIRSNIAYNEDIIDELYEEKMNIERELDELDALKSKISNLQAKFEDRQQHRQNMLLGFTRSVIQNKILKTYYEGMKSLLEGTDFHNACAGLWESKQRIHSKMMALEGELSRCNESIAYRRGRCEYWRAQLAAALAEEAE